MRMNDNWQSYMSLTIDQNTWMTIDSHAWVLPLARIHHASHWSIHDQREYTKHNIPSFDARWPRQLQPHCWTPQWSLCVDIACMMVSMPPNDTILALFISVTHAYVDVSQETVMFMWDKFFDFVPQKAKHATEGDKEERINRHEHTMVETKPAQSITSIKLYFTVIFMSGHCTDDCLNRSKCYNLDDVFCHIKHREEACISSR